MLRSRLFRSLKALRLWRRRACAKGLTGLLLGLSILGAAVPAQAQEPHRLRPHATLRPAQPSASLSPAQAAQLAQRRYGGRVLAVEGNGNGYRVKMLKDGEVRTYQINP